MKAVELIILLAVIILAYYIFGFFGLIGGVVVSILVATGKIKTGLEGKPDNKKESGGKKKEFEKFK